MASLPTKTRTWEEKPRASSGSTTQHNGTKLSNPPTKLKRRGLAENQN